MYKLQSKFNAFITKYTIIWLWGGASQWVVWWWWGGGGELWDLVTKTITSILFHLFISNLWWLKEVKLFMNKDIHQSCRILFKHLCTTITTLSHIMAKLIQICFKLYILHLTRKLSILKSRLDLVKHTFMHNLIHHQ